MSFVINDENIRDLVNKYINDWNSLPRQLRNIPIGQWNVSRVTNMSYLFYNQTTFNEPLNWNVSNVENMSNMFNNAIMFNSPLTWNGGPWNVSNVESMNDMFYGASSFNQNIGNWNVSNVRAMSGMFANATSFNQDLSHWNISRVEFTASMFLNATSFRIDPHWNIDTRRVDAEDMFTGSGLDPNAPAQTPAPPQVAPTPTPATIITDDNIQHLVHTYIHNPIRLPADLRNVPIGDWDVSRVTNMRQLFQEERTFNEPLNDWNVSNVTNMHSMFDRASSFNQPLDRWDISNVRDMNYMFYGASSLTYHPNWDIGPQVSTVNMFDDTPLRGQRRRVIAQPEPVPAPPAPMRTRGRAREQAEPRPPQPPAAAPEGIAYEIHNAFDNFKLNKFMEIIQREITANPPAPGILPLFENPDNILYPIIAYTFKQTGLTQQEKEEKISQLNLIQRTIESYEGFAANRQKIIDVLKFVMTQPREFIDNYIQTLLTDCLKAYSTGRTTSCVRGMYERVYFSVRDAIAALCLDQMQGTGPAPLCKPSYIELFECFYEVWPKEGPGGLNEMMQEWYGDGEEVSALSPENRIESFMNFVRNKINNAMRFQQAEASIRKYANEDLNAMFGGKKRKTKKRYTKKRKNIKRRKSVKKSYKKK